MKAGIAVVLLAVAVIWAALSWPRPAAAPLQIIKEARTETQAHGDDIKEHKQITKKRGGEIRVNKEIEIRALSSDALVDRHRAALLRFGGLSDDHEGAERVDGN